MPALQEKAVDKKSRYKFYQAPACFVERHWGTIGPLLREALPVGSVETEETNVRLLEAVAKEVLQVWIVISADSTQKGDLVGVFSTYTTVDPFTGEKQLVIYTVTTQGRANPLAFVEGYGKLCAYGKGHGCKTLSARINNEQLKGLTTRLGATFYEVATMEI